jgi:hypothetical protein
MITGTFNNSGFFQDRTNEVTIALFNGSNYLDATTLDDAEYRLYDCYGNPAVTKTISGGGIDVVLVGSDNVLVVSLTAEESNLCGKVLHDLKVSLSPSIYNGVRLSTPVLSFAKTRGG